LYLAIDYLLDAAVYNSHHKRKPYTKEEVCGDVYTLARFEVIFSKMKEADGIILSTLVYYGAAAPQLVGFLQVLQQARALGCLTRHNDIGFALQFVVGVRFYY
jgi:multimeric flavodoxin WrbA